jgi:TonB family protein
MHRVQPFTLLLVLSLFCGSMTSARGMGPRESILVTLHVGCLNDLMGLQRKDPDIVPIAIDPSLLLKFCQCADTGMQSDPWLDRIAKMPAADRGEHSKAATLLRQSYINHGLECMPKPPKEPAGATPHRSIDNIREVLGRRGPQFYAAYKRELATNLSLAGKVVLSITIEPSGRVSDVSIQSSTLGNSQLELALLDLVRETDFGPMEVKTTVIAFPIDFIPQ